MKNDLKYIIKKIIIGIGIALGIMFFKPYIAFADTINITAEFKIANRNSLNFYDTSNLSIDSSNFKIQNSKLPNNIIYNFLYYNSYSGSYNTSDTYFLLYSESLDKYYIYYSTITASGDNYYVDIKTTGSSFSTYVYNNDDTLYTSGSSYMVGSFSFNSSSNLSTITNLDNLTIYSNYNLANNTSSYNLPEDTQIISCSSLYSSYKINGIDKLYVPAPEFPPTGYEQINLNGYQAVLVTPKNFNTMLNESSHTEQPIPGTTHTYLDLDYYSQNCVRGVLINIQNVQNILTSDISSGSGLGASAGAINGTCFEEPTKTTLSYQYDIYSGFVPQGILIYNNQKTEPSWDSGFNSDFNPFGESFVWINTNLYNYYLILNLTTFNTDINYVDYDNTEKNLIIENLPTFEDLIKDTQLNQDSVNDNLNTRAKLESIFSFVKIPFTFLNNLINGTCEPLTARFPYSSTDIVLPCLSSSFAGWLGENAYKFFQLIINGLLVYKISIGLIQFTTKNLDPSDARIEVLDL